MGNAYACSIPVVGFYDWTEVMTDPPIGLLRETYKELMRASAFAIFPAVSAVSVQAFLFSNRQLALWWEVSDLRI